MNDDRDLLIEAYLDGTLDAAGARILADALRAGGAEAGRIRARIALSGLLGVVLDEADGTAVVRSVGERLDALDGGTAFVRRIGRSLPRPRPVRRWWQRPATACLVAAGLIAAIVLGLWMQAGQGVVPPPCTVITAAAGVGIEHLGVRRPAIGGEPLLLGDRIGGSGTASLRLADGSRFDLETGAHLNLVAAGHLALDHGAIAADISPQAPGTRLVVSTPEARVEVIGTRFRLATAAGRSDLDLQIGSVRLVDLADGSARTLQAGERASLGAMPPPAAPAGRDLFPPAGLAGWVSEHGEWRNDRGTIRGTATPQRKARLVSQADFADFELTCRMRVTSSGAVRQAEIQTDGYRWLFVVPESHGRWVAIRLLRRGDDPTCTADGTALVRDIGDNQRSGPGPLAFYAPPGGSIEISDARISPSEPAPRNRP